MWQVAHQASAYVDFGFPKQKGTRDISTFPWMEC